jgi:hypothetical protein
MIPLLTAKFCSKLYHLSVSVVCILYIEDATRWTCRNIFLNCWNCRDFTACGFVWFWSPLETMIKLKLSSKILETACNFRMFCWPCSLV